MILRNFLYLDIASVTDYLSTLEGIIPEAVDQTETERKGKSGKVGIQIAEGGAESEKSLQTLRKSAVTDAARFQRLYELVEEEVLYLDAFDEEFWSQIRRNDLLEIQSTIRLPELFVQMQALEALPTLVDLMQDFGASPLADEKTLSQIDSFLRFRKTTEEKAIPLLFEAASTPGFRFVSSLQKSYLRCELSDLQGEATVFGKVQRILNKSEQQEVYSLFSAFNLSFPGVSKKQLNQLKKDLSKHNLTETIAGPAIMLIPVAIYR